MGLGSLKVDVRDVELPPGRTDLPLEIGMGEIQVLVPDDLCVTAEGDIGMGAFDLGGGEQGGVDLEVREGTGAEPGVRELHLEPDIGVGALLVGNDFFEDHGPDRWRDRGFDSLEAGTNRLACLEPA
jgi:hypothetical protein